MTIEEQTAGAPAPLAGYTAFYLLRVFQRLQAWGRRSMPAGRHPRDLAVLASIEHCGPVSQRNLAELLGFNPTIVVKLVDAVEASGLVRRERDPADRRAYALTLSAAGHRVLSVLDSVAAEGEAGVAAPLTKRERGRLRTLLTAVLPPTADLLSPRLTDTFGFLVANTHVRLDERRSRAMAELGYEPADAAYLVAIGRAQPCSQRQLADRAGVTSPAISGVVNDLVRAGLVSRTRNPEDRRQYVLRLTDVGEEELRRIRTALDALHDEFFAALDESERAELDHLLAKILGVL